MCVLYVVHVCMWCRMHTCIMSIPSPCMNIYRYIQYSTECTCDTWLWTFLCAFEFPFSNLNFYALPSLNFPCILYEGVFYTFRNALPCFLTSILKEELHNRFNLISEERVKNFKHNSENLMKIGWKIRKLHDILKFRKFSRNISWPVDMNMQMSELMMSSPHYLPYILYTKFCHIFCTQIFLKILIFCPNLW